MPKLATRNSSVATCACCGSRLTTSAQSRVRLPATGGSGWIVISPWAYQGHSPPGKVTGPGSPGSSGVSEGVGDSLGVCEGVSVSLGVCVGVVDETGPCVRVGVDVGRGA